MSRSSTRLHAKKKKQQDKLLYRAILVVAFVEPLTTTGQMWQIWKHKDVQGNSLFMWGFFEISAIIWFIYALKIKNKPLIITEFLWVVTQAVVIAQLLYYM